MRYASLLPLLLLMGICFSSAFAAEGNPLAEKAKVVRHTLRSNILDFWAKNSPDKKHGGFITDLDEKGKPTGEDKKYLLTQTRMVWVFSAAHRHGIQDKGYLDLAKHGYRFLIEKMWDREHGGFYWLVDGDGKVLRDSKSVYTQTFAIYALSEYFLASREAEALTYAEKLFDLFATKAKDGEYGYRENFNRDWTAKKSTRKTLDTHMHLMECFTTLYEASGKEKHRKALEDVVELILKRCIHPTERYAFEPYDRHFKPIPGKGKQMVTSYGHNVELGWLLLEACRVLKRDRDTYKKVILGLIDHAIEFGCDNERGGVALYGPPTGHVLQAGNLDKRRLLKSWWEQSEMLVATLEAYAWTSEKKYVDAFNKTFDWTWKHLVDMEHGEWFAATKWDGTRALSSNKGGGWKSAYHNGRALMMLEKRFRLMAEPKRP